MHDQAESIIRLLNLCRHEVINHLQVISGLAQLNKTEKLQSCVRKVNEELYQMGRLASCGDARLGLLIYDAFAKTPENSLSVEYNGTMPVLSQASLKLAAKLIDACKEYLLREESVLLKIALGGGDTPSITLRFSSVSGKQPKLGCLLENAAGHDLAAVISDEGGALTLLLDKQEQISEQ